MGEKIKDISKIYIGDVSFTIELNESYNQNEFKDIHIQNERFRYLLNEYDFLHVCAEILRANDELKYLKDHPKKGRNMKNDNILSFADDDAFVELLKNENIDYRFIEKGKKYITLIINPEHKNKIKKLIEKEKNIKKLIHPYSKSNGYSFLYQMHEFLALKYFDNYYEIYFQLPCMSLTEKTWIPLDSYIQKRIWNKNYRNMIDDISYYIYRLCWAVFKDNAFSSSTLQALDYYQNILLEKEFEICMKKVFFSYSKKMINLLKNKKYNEIINDYFTFMEY